MNRDHGFSLVPLECKSCGASIEAEGMDVVFYCSACRSGYRYDRVRSTLTPVEVSFVSKPDLVVDEYRPFWLLPAKIKIHHRLAQGKGLGGMLRQALSGDDAAGGSGSGTFAIPAFQVDLARAIEISRWYTLGLPELSETLGEPLVGGCFDVDDAKKLAHFGIIATEVDKPDMLKDLKYEVEFGTPRLLGVPFVRDTGVLKDAFFHLVV